MLKFLSRRKKLSLSTAGVSLMAAGMAFGYAGEDILSGAPFHHFDISLRALAGDNAIKGRTGGDTFPGIGFSPAAATAIGWHADYIDSYLYSPIWWAEGFSDAGGLADKDNRLKASLAQFHHLERLHFDDLFTVSGVEDTWRRYGGGTLAGLEWAASQNDVAAAYNILGVSVHAVQDFYSHSSFISTEANRNKTWQCSTPSQRRNNLYTGAYETPERAAQHHHGKVSLECSVFRTAQYKQMEDFADIACSGVSPYNQSTFCISYRQCPTGNTNLDVQSVAGRIPSALVLNPKGIALDSSYLAKPGGITRGLLNDNGRFITGKSNNFVSLEQCDLISNFGVSCDEGAAHAQSCPVETTRSCASDHERIFATSKLLATESTAQWVKSIDGYMSVQHPSFWNRVRSGQTKDVSLKSRTQQFEDFSQMPFQFLSAGPYPVNNPRLGTHTFEKSADGWYLRLRLKTADKQGAGTDADIIASVKSSAGTQDFTLDYMPIGSNASTSLALTSVQSDTPMGRALAYNDFERGDNDVYTIGPIKGAPISLTLKSKAATTGDAVEAVFNDVGEKIKNFFDPSKLAVNFGSIEDVVGNDVKTINFSELRGASNKTYTLVGDGKSEGKYSISVKITDKGTSGLDNQTKAAGHRNFEIVPQSLKVIRESDVDGFLSDSDEPFAFGSFTAFNGSLTQQEQFVHFPVKIRVRPQLKDQSFSYKMDPVNDGMDSGDVKSLTWPTLTATLAPNGAVVLAAAFFESDEETDADRNRSFNNFVTGVEKAEPAPFSKSLSTIGSAAGSEWALAEIDVYGFYRSDVVKTKSLYSSRQGWTIPGNGTRTFRLNTSAPRTIGRVDDIFKWTKGSISTLSGGAEICGGPQSAQFSQNENTVSDQFSRTENAALSGYNDKTFNNYTVAQCQSACLNEKSFYCKSFDYGKETGRCDLSKNDASGKTSLKRDYPGNPYDHYKRVSKASQAAIAEKFSHTRNAALSGYNHKSFSNYTVAQCQSACVNEDSFYCKSIDYNKNTGQCDLSKNDASAGLSLSTDYPGNPYDHYKRLSK
ncbi:PAN/Apple domain-containing protein [Litorimonas taeanensis]|nr:PAN/Apple domain-containing protein [Litorimonas taeanensis]